MRHGQVDRPNSYRITIPADAMDDPGLVERVHTYLEDRGFTVEGVTTERVIDAEAGGERFQIPGPFLRIESSADPTDEMARFSWQRPTPPDVQKVRDFLTDHVEGEDPSADALAALARLTLRTVGEFEPEVVE